MKRKLHSGTQQASASQQTTLRNKSGEFFCCSSRYAGGFSNSGTLLGSCIPRRGQGSQAWATQWFAPRNKLQFNFRHQKVSKRFIPDGGALTDARVNADFPVRSRNRASSVQYEHWDFPGISSTRKMNVTESILLTFWPWLHSENVNNGTVSGRRCLRAFGRVTVNKS
jgi:hypothetical protein